MQPGHDTATFTDASTPGAGGAPIVGRLFGFGDPATGAADAATAAPATHTFSAPGSYRVVLIVIDANGLTASSTQTVVVPGRPAARRTQASKRTVASTALSSPIS